MWLRCFRPIREMWGSDYPICMNRGRAVTVAGKQTWLTGKSIGLGRTRILAENLLAFHEAAVLLGLDQTQISDLFYENARTLFQSVSGQATI